jgi:hypothetical protein
MTKSYEQRKASNEKYLAKLDEIKIRLPKGEKEKIKAHAESGGESVNAFINRAITETMTRDKNTVEDVAAMYPTPNQIQKIKELKEQRKKQGE